jgi:hypothetical protein
MADDQLYGRVSTQLTMHVVIATADRTPVVLWESADAQIKIAPRS